jgi:Membrane protein involved in the export of O-antigen and teichoic acid
VATLLALAGAGFWALVAQQVTQAGVVLVALALGAGWLPGRYRRGVPMRRFLSFGVRLVGSQLIAYIGSNIDTVMLGLRASAGALGVYNRTYQLVMTPVGQVRGPLNTVAIPVLSRLQDHDRRFQSTVARGQVAMGYTLVTGLALMAGSAAPLVTVVLGDAWLQAIPVLRLLAIGAGLQTLSYVGYWVYVTKGLVDHLLHYTFISTGIRVTLVIIGSSFGLVGVAAAMAVAPAVAWPLSIWWLSRRASIPVRQLWVGGMRVLMFSVLVGAATHGGVTLASLSWWSGMGAVWVQLLVGIGCGLVAYALAAVAVPLFRRDVRDVAALVRLGLRR